MIKFKDGGIKFSVTIENQDGEETTYYLGEFKTWNLALKAAHEEAKYKNGDLVELKRKVEYK